MQSTKIEWKMTIPNLLSFFRIALVPVFAVLYLNSAGNAVMLYSALGVLVLSGLTDLFDGMIARRCHQITELGKLLDPLADKLTQVTVLICLTIRIPQLWPLAIICLLKELIQLIGGAVLLKHQQRVRGSNWYGKVSTTVFYVVMALIFAFPVDTAAAPLLFGWHMPQWLFVTLIGVVVLWMLFSFYKYIRVYLAIRQEWRQPALSKKQELPAEDSSKS